MRRIGLGLIIAAALAEHFWVDFARYIVERPSVYPFNMAMQSMSNTITDQLGSAAIVPAIFLFLCLGAGLLAADALFTVLFGVALPLLSRGEALAVRALSRPVRMSDDA